MPISLESRHQSARQKCASTFEGAKVCCKLRWSTWLTGMSCSFQIRRSALFQCLHSGDGLICWQRPCCLHIVCTPWSAAFSRHDAQSQAGGRARQMVEGSALAQAECWALRQVDGHVQGVPVLELGHQALLHGQLLQVLPLPEEVPAQRVRTETLYMPE